MTDAEKGALIDDYFRRGGKVTICPPGPGLADYKRGARRDRSWKEGLYRKPVRIEWFDNYLKNPYISEAAFPRRESGSVFAYGELEDRDKIERQAVIEELADLGRLGDAQ